MIGRMRIRSATLLAAAAVAASLLATSAGSAAPSATSASEEAFQVLVFSRTTGYRHASIEIGIEAIRGIGEENGSGSRRPRTRRSSRRRTWRNSRR